LNRGETEHRCRAERSATHLNKATHQLKPDANAKQATKDAEQQAKDDLKAIGG
jgi:hypothetical protein